MTPIRDPGDRSLRRMGRDLAELERRRRESATRAPRHPEEAVDEIADDESPQLHAEWSDEELERLPMRARHGRRPADEAKRHAARAVAEVDATAAAAEGVATDVLEGVVTATSRGPCEVELEHGERVRAQLPKALARGDRSVLAVGDRVELAARSSGDLAVTRRLPRVSRLSRPDPFQPHRERVLVANLDLGVIVASLRHPPLATGLIDRFLVALQHGGVAAAVAVNKLDLADVEEARAGFELLEPYRALGVPVAFCSARSGEGLDVVRAWLERRTVAFVGHSGVGKSSLLNALVPNAGAATAEVSARGGKGRHTTTQAQVYRLPSGGRVVDTPGVREFGLWRLTARELAAYFDEFAAFASGCRFGDCTHAHEPDCAVRAAAEASALAPERFATYLRILASFERE